jgi:hypothetical protein
MRILVTGGTGFVGTALTESLSSEGHGIVLLTRRDVPPPGKELPMEWLDGIDAIVNMAGESIAGNRWTDSYKRRIRQSRIPLTQAIVKACGDAVKKGLPVPRVLVSFSAVGYYGTDPSADFDEQSPPGKSWLAQVARDWEMATEGTSDAKVRLVILRLGVVLGPGGFLQRLAPAFRLFAGGPAGDGRQWISWVHRDDVVAVVEKAIGDATMQGVYNLTVPEPATMAQMASAIGMALGRPSWLRVPSFVLRLLLGEMADELILNGQRVLPKRLAEAGFSFQHPELSEAVKASFPND